LVEQAAVGLQHAVVHRLQRRAGGDPELGVELLPQAVEDVQGLGLAAGPVQRVHQQLSERLAVGMLGKQRPQLGGCRRVLAERDVGR
jgi:hypothetical protein